MEFNLDCERLVATAIEATMIVVECRLHGDPIPSLRGHRRVIVEERERLYRWNQHIQRSTLDGLLQERGVRALRQEFRADTRSDHGELRRTFVELLFHDAELLPSRQAGPDVTHTVRWCEGGQLALSAATASAACSNARKMQSTSSE